MRNGIFPALLVLGVICAVPAMAMPPFSYDSAARWADETVTSDIPKAERVYILGPDKVTETYTLDGLPARHDEEVRHAVLFRSGLTVAQVLRNIRIDPKRHYFVNVYRAGAVQSPPPCFQAEAGNAKLGKFVLQRRDIVEVVYYDPNEKARPVI